MNLGKAMKIFHCVRLYLICSSNLATLTRAQFPNHLFFFRRKTLSTEAKTLGTDFDKTEEFLNALQVRAVFRVFEFKTQSWQPAVFAFLQLRIAAKCPGNCCAGLTTND